MATSSFSQSATNFIKSITTPASQKKEDPKQNQRTTTTSTGSYVYSTPPQTTKPSGGGTPTYSGGIITTGKGSYTPSTKSYGGGGGTTTTQKLTGQVPPATGTMVISQEDLAKTIGRSAYVVPSDLNYFEAIEVGGLLSGFPAFESNRRLNKPTPFGASDIQIKKDTEKFHTQQATDVANLYLGTSRAFQASPESFIEKLGVTTTSTAEGKTIELTPAYFESELTPIMNRQLVEGTMVGGKFVSNKEIGFTPTGIIRSSELLGTKAMYYPSLGLQKLGVPVSAETMGSVFGTSLLFAGASPFLKTTGELTRALSTPVTSVRFGGTQQIIKENRIQTDILFTTSKGKTGVARGVSNVLETEQGQLSTTVTAGRIGNRVVVPDLFKGFRMEVTKQKGFAGLQASRATPTSALFKIQKGLSIEKEAFRIESFGSIAQSPSRELTKGFIDFSRIPIRTGRELTKGTEVFGYKSLGLGVKGEKFFNIFSVSKSKFGITKSFGKIKEIEGLKIEYDIAGAFAKGYPTASLKQTSLFAPSQQAMFDVRQTIKMGVQQIPKQTTFGLGLKQTLATSTVSIKSLNLKQTSIMGARTKLASRTIYIPRVTTAVRTTQPSRSGLKTIVVQESLLKQSQGLVSLQGTKLALKSGLALKQTYKQVQPTRETTLSFAFAGGGFGFPPIIPPLTPSFGRTTYKKSKLLKFSTKYRYTPSFTAVALGIRGKQPKPLSKMLGYNPYTIRPLLK